MSQALDPVYIKTIKAFQYDSKKLIESFKKENSDDIRHFLYHWKSQKFYLVYEKYANQAVLHDIKQDTLQIAKSIMFNDHFVGGFYLMYGLYYIQGDPKPTIRFDREEFKKLCEKFCRCTERKTVLEHEAKKPPLIAGLFYLSKLIMANAFCLVKFSREYNIEGLHRARMIFDNEVSFIERERRLKPSEWLAGFLNNIGSIKEFQDVDDETLTQKLKVKQEFPELSLDMVEDDIVSTLFKVLSQEESKTDPISSICEDVEMSIGERRRALKNRVRKIKYRYQNECSDEDSPPDFLPKKISKPAITGRKRGAPKGERKYFFNKAVNSPESDSQEDGASSKTEPSPTSCEDDPLH